MRPGASPQTTSRFAAKTAGDAFPRTLFEAAGAVAPIEARPAWTPEPTGAAMCAQGVSFGVLGSSSSGNCSFIRVGSQKNYRLILLDCGLSPLRTRKLLASLGMDVERVAAIVLTHLHRDHFKETWLKRLPSAARFYVHHRHRGVAQRSGVMHRRTEVFADEPFELLGLRGEARIGPHDDLGSAVLRFDTPADETGRSQSLGYATDIGCVTDAVGELIEAVDVLAIESNYCTRMQLASGRHQVLIDRIMQGGGHLSNDESAAAVAELAPRERIVLLHLSRQCNAPDIAVGCHLDAHGGGPHGALVEAAPETGPTDPIDLVPRPTA